MPAADPWKRYLEAGVELTQLTRARAEKVVKDLVKAGEVQGHEAAQWVEDLLERSRKTTEGIAETVRVEVQKQLQNLGLVQAPKKVEPTAKAAAATKTAAKKAAKKPAATAKKAAKKPVKKTAAKARTSTKKASGSS